MASNGKIPVELTPEQMADLIDAATRAAEQDQEDAEILSRKPQTVMAARLCGRDSDTSVAERSTTRRNPHETQ